MTEQDESPAEPPREAGQTTVAMDVTHSTVGAVAQGPNAHASNTVHNSGLGYSDVRDIVDERIMAAVGELRSAVGRARDQAVDDMLRISAAVIHSLMRTRFGSEVDSATVAAAFLREALDAPAFPARASRLFQEGIKSPSTDRQRMLAAALFGLTAETPDRDRIDSAFERLFPADVTLLAGLLRFPLPHLLLVEDRETQPFVIRDEDRNDMLMNRPLPRPQLVCDAFALYNLQAIACIQIDGRTRGFGADQRYSLAALVILPLGHAVARTLRAAGAIDASGSRCP